MGICRLKSDWRNRKCVTWIQGAVELTYLEGMGSEFLLAERLYERGPFVLQWPVEIQFWPKPLSKKQPQYTHTITAIHLRWHTLTPFLCVYTKFISPKGNIISEIMCALPHGSVGKKSACNAGMQQTQVWSKIIIVIFFC